MISVLICPLNDAPWYVLLFFAIILYSTNKVEYGLFAVTSNNNYGVVPDEKHVFLRIISADPLESAKLIGQSISNFPE